jgi:hypothetical protein
LDIAGLAKIPKIDHHFFYILLGMTTMVGYITKLPKEKIKYICEWGWVYFCKLANVLFWQTFKT